VYIIFYLINGYWVWNAYPILLVREPADIFAIPTRVHQLENKFIGWNTGMKLTNWVPSFLWNLIAICHIAKVDMLHKSNNNFLQRLVDATINFLAPFFWTIIFLLCLIYVSIKLHCGYAKNYFLCWSFQHRFL
jgi:small basic protein